MSDRYWRVFFGAGVTLAVAVAFGWLLGFGQAKQAQYAERTPLNSVAQSTEGDGKTDGGNDEPSRSPLISSERGDPSLLQAPPETENATQESSTAEKDLVAQERMAIAAERLVELTLGQIVLGVVGALLLGWTLWETRKVVRVTDDAGIAQIRAYLSVKGVSLYSKFEAPHGEPQRRNVHLTHSARIVNNGQTQAQNVRLVGDITLAGSYPNDQDRLVLRNYDKKFFNVSPQVDFQLFEEEDIIILEPDDWMKFRYEQYSIRIRLYVWYDDVSRRTARETPIHFDVNWSETRPAGMGLTKLAQSDQST